MHYNIVRTSAVTFILGVIAVGCTNQENDASAVSEETPVNYVSEEDAKEDLPDFTYNVTSPYWATISKQDLFNAKSVIDIVPDDAVTWRSMPFESVDIVVLTDPFEIKESGTEKTLNAAQTKLLHSTDYGSNFYIRAQGAEIDPETGNVEVYNYYFSIVPEKQAAYKHGEEGLIDYIEGSNKAFMSSVKNDQLKGGLINFTIMENGDVSNVELQSSCGYTAIDNNVLELIKNLPERWSPAESAEGVAVKQDLVFTYGMVGC